MTTDPTRWHTPTLKDRKPNYAPPILAWVGDTIRLKDGTLHTVAERGYDDSWTTTDGRRVIRNEIDWDHLRQSRGIPRDPWAPPTPRANWEAPTARANWAPPKPVEPSHITGSGYPEGFLERMGYTGAQRPRVAAAPKPAPRPVRKLRKTPVEFKSEALRQKWQAWRTRRRLGNKRKSINLTIREHFDRRRLLAFGTSLLGYDITKLMDPPKRGGVKAHSAKCRAGRKGAKGGPGFIRTDPRCPACKAQKRGKR